jgi:hypothetical protein
LLFDPNTRLRYANSSAAQNPIRTDELSWKLATNCCVRATAEGRALATLSKRHSAFCVYGVVSFQSQLVRSSQFVNRRVNIEMVGDKVEPTRARLFKAADLAHTLFIPLCRCLSLAVRLPIYLSACSFTRRRRFEPFLCDAHVYNRISM